MCERYIDWLPLACPQLRTQHATQACALTGNRTCDLLVRRLALNPLSHTSPGMILIMNKSNVFLKYTQSGFITFTFYSAIIIFFFLMLLLPINGFTAHLQAFCRCFCLAEAAPLSSRDHQNCLPWALSHSKMFTWAIVLE